MGDDEGRGHNFEAEHPFGRRLLHPRARARTEALAFEIGGDAAEHFRQIGPPCHSTDQAHRRSHAARPSGMPRSSFNALSTRATNVAHHLRRRVPDAELLAQFGIERLQERLVEIRHRLSLAEPREEGGAVHAVERRRRPVPRRGRAVAGGRAGIAAGTRPRALARANARPLHANEMHRLATATAAPTAPRPRRRRRRASAPRSNGRSARPSRPRTGHPALLPMPSAPP